jgi:flagellar protein FliS
MQKRLDRYVSTTATTTSPQKLVVMLYERLERDLLNAESALVTGDRTAANGFIGHAEEIVAELASSLKPELWDGARGLSDIYSYLLTQLLTASVRQDVALVQACRQLVSPLHEAWRQAYEMTQAQRVAS